MNSSEQIAPPEARIPPLTQQMEELLDQAAQQTGRSREEILHACLKHGIERILQDTGNSDSP